MRALFYVSAASLLVAGGVLAYLLSADSHGVPAEPPAASGALTEGEAEEPDAVQKRLGPVEGTPEAPGAKEPDAAVTARTGQGGAGEAIERGASAFNAGDYESALDIFMGVLKEDERALTGAGLSHFKLGHYDRAVRFLEDSIRRGGDDFLARKFLALSYYKMDDLQRSALNAERVLALREDVEMEKFLKKVSAELNAQSNRVDEETLHFKAVFDGYRHGVVSRTVLGILEDAYAELGREFGHFPEDPVTVVLYTERDFFDVTMLPAFTAGAFDGKIRLPVKGLEDESRESMRHVLFHEYVHALVHSITQNAPLWLNEGLAEYLVPRGFKKTGQALPLKSLERAFPLNDQALTIAAYIVSYSAVYHLAERHGLYRLKELLFALGRREGLNEAFYSSFYVTYDEFVAMWGRQ